MRRHGGWTARIAAGFCVAWLAAVALTACSSGDSGATDASDAAASSTSSVVPTAESLVEFRPVLAVGPADAAVPCPEGIAEPLDPDAPVTVPQCDADTSVATYQLGPTLVGGSAIESATAGLGQGGQWIVTPVLREGAEGIDLFNDAAARCYSKSEECPTGQLAVVVNGSVISAPSIEQEQFARDQIQISGSFTEESAKNLALLFKMAAVRGAQPGGS